MNALEPSIRTLTQEDAAQFHELRLKGLKSAPEAFGSSYEEEMHLHLVEVGKRLAARPDVVFGAFDGGQLIGVAGFATNRKAKERHKGILWGIFVDPQGRGRRLGDSLVQAVIDHARLHVDTLCATVNARNISARSLYLKKGFTVYGFERDALRVNGVSHDEELLRLELQ